MKSEKKIILAIETSCDETAAAVLECYKSKNGYEMNIVSNVVASQIEIHKKWGGVYPELASRAHLEAMIPVLESALRPLSIILNEVKDLRRMPAPTRDSSPSTSLRVRMTKIDAIAVTVGPGLIGSLLMGAETAQILGAYFKKPIVPVNHLEGHVYSAFAKYKVKSQNLKVNIPYSGIFPLLALVVSGGHTSLILMEDHLTYRTVGQTIDDAAGEAFDKVARILELGYPGGPAIEKLAKKGNPDAYKLPLSMLNSKDLNFSFSGLKTAVLYLVRPPSATGSNSKISSVLHSPSATGSNSNYSSSEAKRSREAPKIDKAGLAASFQKTVAEILTQKTIMAIKKYRPKTIILSGGVSANQYLRDCLASEISNFSPASPAGGLSTFHFQLNFLAPLKNLSTDNAVGIALAGAIKFLNNESVHWSKIEASSNLTIG